MKKYRWLFVVIGVFVLGGALLFSAALGAGITYFFLQAEPAQAALSAPVNIEETEGVLISSVMPESAAAQAGLVRGDIILEINGEPVNSLIEMKDVLSEFQPADKVELTVLHGDERRTLETELGDSDGMAFLGVNSCGLARGSKAFPGNPMGDIIIKGFVNGAEIVDVLPDSPALSAGLKVGDVIVSVNQESISQEKSLADLIQAYEPGDQVTLEIQSEGADETREVLVILAENPDNPDQAYLGVTYQPSLPIHGFEGELPFMEGIPFGELPEGFEGQLPEGWEDKMPHFFNIPELPEGVEGAVVISEVMEDTPAAEAGLQPGDLIIAIDDDVVEEIDAFVQVLQSHQPGDEITLTVIRQGEKIGVKVTLTAHPDDPAKGYLGVLAGTFTLREELELPEGFDQNFELPGVPGGDA